MSTSELVVLLDEVPIGEVRRDGARLSFAYREEWRRASGGFPLSLSMPLAKAEHLHRVVDAFLWGLLPDNELILDRWAKRFQVSARSAFALLSHVGDDCAGAVRLLPPDRLETRADAPADDVEWLDEGAVAERLRTLRSDISAWRWNDDGGQFSLGGAQPKTALRFDGQRWGIPTGCLATTHILKPGIAELDGHAENEHLCLELARALELPAATSRVVRFEDQVAIVVERYDRVWRDASVLRVHQEDICQALAVVPTRKYESDQGPGARAIVELLREFSSAPAEDIDTFVAALGFAWLTGGTDAHAKNYAVLIGDRARVRLAPLYDVASVLPYSVNRERKLKLAMKIGGTYRLHEIGALQWKKLAKELALDFDAMRDRLLAMTAAIGDHAADIAARARKEGADHAVLERLVSLLRDRAKICATELSAA